MVSCGYPSRAFFFQGSDVCKPAVEALALHGREFKSGHSQPGAVLGCVTPFDFLCNSSGFRRREFFLA